MIAKIGDWINCNAAAIQAISAFLASVFTAVYVFLTFRYVKRTGEVIALTRGQLEEQRRSLALLREQVEQQKQALKLTETQFEREWEPQLRIWVHRTNPNDVRLEVVNLGRTAIHIERILYGAGIGTEPKTESIQWLTLIPVNQSTSRNIHPELLGAAGRLFHIGPAVLQNVNMAARVEYFSAGKLHQTEWFHFEATIREHVITELKPSVEKGRV